MGWFLLTPRFTPFYLANGSRWIQHKVVESIEQVNFGGTVMPQLLLVGDGVEQGSSYHPKKGKVPADVLANYIVYLDTLDTIIKSAPKGMHTDIPCCFDYSPPSFFFPSPPFFFAFLLFRFEISIQLYAPPPQKKIC